LDQGHLPDKLLKLLIVVHPGFNLFLEILGNIEGAGLSVFLPGQIEDGVLWASLVTGTVLLAATAGGGDQCALDPWTEGGNLPDKTLTLNLERAFGGRHILIV
jgi:hypothetical protein